MLAFGCAPCAPGLQASGLQAPGVQAGRRRPARAPRRPRAVCCVRGGVRPSSASLLAYMQELRPRLEYLSPEERQCVLSALEVAMVAHSGQMRKSGEPFIIHPIAVAAILAEMRMDRDSVIAGLLHDTVEDTATTLEELETLFGRDVRKIVEGETKFSILAAKVHGQAVADESEKRAQERKSANPRKETDERGDERGGRAPGKKKPAAPPDSVGGLVWARERDQAKREADREKQADNLRAMFMAMTEDVRVIIVKLADRLHNLRTLEHMSPAKQKKKARETLEFFAPLAHRLGMRRIKSELEELSFRYQYPEEYRNVRNEVEALKRRTRFAQKIALAENTVRDVLQSDAFLGHRCRSVKVTGSTKELYSIYRRQLRGESINSMLDIATLTVVVDIPPSVDCNQACYHVLGRLHSIWTPLPKRLKDYIAFPKPNGYQSLHTTLLLDQTQGFMSLEVQIRTAAMHRVAEEGIAAELFQPDIERPMNARRFLRGGGSDDVDDVPPTENSPFSAAMTRSSSPAPSYLSAMTSSSASSSVVRGDDEWRRRMRHWLISIREYIDEFSSSRDLVDAVRRDLLGNRVFVFTPGRNIVDLIRGSTPVDLAYAIHSDVGHQMIGAKVNHRIVALDYKLENADVVQIITSDSSAGPAAEWMAYAKSRTARQKIRQRLRALEKEEFMNRGRDILSEAALKHREPEPLDEELHAIMPRLRVVLSAVSGLDHVKSVEQVFLAIGRGISGSGNLSLKETVLTLLQGYRQTMSSENELSGPDMANGEYSLATQPDDDELASTLDFGETFEEEDADDHLVAELNGGVHVAVDTPDTTSSAHPESDECETDVGHIELATCCHPICGDEVMGVRVDDGASVLVHRLHCRHMLSLLKERPVNPKIVGVRWVGQGLSWEEKPFGKFAPPRMLLESGRVGSGTRPEEGRPCQPARIAITARDCDGLLSYVTGIVAGLGKSIRRSCTETEPNTLVATLAFEVLVEDLDELKKIVDRLNECEEVMSVRRVGANEGDDFFPPARRGRQMNSNQTTTGQARLIQVVNDKRIIGDVSKNADSLLDESELNGYELHGMGFRLSPEMVEIDEMNPETS